MKYLFNSVLIVILIMFTACDFEKKLPEPFISGLDDIREKFAPDKRTKVFNVDYTYESGKWLINCETTETKIQEALEAHAEQTLSSLDYVLDITLLPDESLGEELYGIVKISAAPLRRHPRHSAEMVDQSILGIELKLLKKQRHWYLVQTPYQYIGWINSSSIKKADKNIIERWQSSDKIIIQSNYAQVFSQKNTKSVAVSDLVLGSLLIDHGAIGKWYKVETPGGDLGYVLKENVGKYVSDSKSQSINTEMLVQQAKKLLGIPYLWGGNSSKGFDCSGFTQTVFKIQGFLLPRDANMQVNTGEPVTPLDDFSNIEAGDLLFFGPDDGRITHVGISLGGYRFIHSSGSVHINSFNQEDDDYNEYRYRTLRQIKRIKK